MLLCSLLSLFLAVEASSLLCFHSALSLPSYSCFSSSYRHSPNDQPRILRNIFPSSHQPLFTIATPCLSDRVSSTTHTSSRPTLPLVYRLETHNSHTHLFIHLDAGRKQSKQSALAKFVMHSLLGLSPSSSPALSALSPSAAPTSALEPDSLPPTSDPSSHSHSQSFAVLPPPSIDDDHLPPPSNHPSSLAVALRAMNDLTETPTYARSVTSTAPSSPRM